MHGNGPTAMLAVAFPRSPAFRSLLPFRNPNRLDHHPLHFFSTHQNFQHKGKLHRAEFQKFHHLCEIVERQSQPIGLDAKTSAIGKAPLQGRRDTPHVPPFEGQTPNRFQFWRWIMILNHRLYEFQIRLSCLVKSPIRVRRPLGGYP